MYIGPKTILVGEQREEVKNEVVKRYGNDESVRTIARDLGRSYGFVHRLLVEAHVVMRARGGYQRRRSTAPNRL